MRNKKGQFIKGHRANPATEFKRGEHWRPKQPYWERDWLYTEYIEKERSAAEIAASFGITETSILFWLKKHKIPTRSMKEIRAIKHWGLRGEANGMYGKRGAEVPNWKGGCSPSRQQFYSSLEWAAACVAVWDRDKARCVRCGVAEDQRTLHVHHIISFAVKEKRADPDNLILLCVKCHRFVHSKRNINNEYIQKGGDANDFVSVAGGLS